MADEKLVYLDTSAFVKLVIPEPETPALVTALTPKTLLRSRHCARHAGRQETTAPAPHAPSSPEYAFCH
jgi:hypothetical protein